jgi:hypothetical protein
MLHWVLIGFLVAIGFALFAVARTALVAALKSGIRWGLLFYRLALAAALVWLVVIMGTAWPGITAPVATPAPLPCVSSQSDTDCKLAIIHDALRGMLSKPVTTPASLGEMVKRAEHPAFVAVLPLLAVLVVGFFRMIRLRDEEALGTIQQRRHG